MLIIYLAITAFLMFLIAKAVDTNTATTTTWDDMGSSKKTIVIFLLAVGWPLWLALFMLILLIGLILYKDPYS